MDTRVVAESLEHVHEDRVSVPVVEGDLGRRANDDEDAGRVDSESAGDVGIGNEPVQVVLLLEPGVAAHLALARPDAVEALLRDDLRNDDPGRRAAAEPVLDPRELVVEGVGRRDRERARGQRQLVRRVGERDVEPPRSREPPQGAKARAHCARLAGTRRARVRRPEHGVLEPGVLEQLERLGEIAGRDRDVVPACLEELDDRPEEDDMRRVGDVDPDAHRGHRRRRAGSSYIGAARRTTHL